VLVLFGAVVVIVVVALIVVHFVDVPLHACHSLKEVGNSRRR